jgi:MFS family permease
MLFVLPAGMILDRVSTRKVILLAMSSSVLCALAFSFANEIWVGAVCRFITGMGGSFCFVSCIRLATRWFPPRRLAFVIGLIVTTAMFGGMLAQTPMTLLTDHYGWRHMLYIDAIAGALMLLPIYLFVKDYPATPTFHQPTHQPLPWGTFLKTLWHSLLNLQNWLGGLYTSLMNMPLMLLGAVWGSLYLVQVHHLTRTEASLVTSMIFVGTIIGSPVIGWLSDRIRLRRSPMIVSAILSILTILIIMLAGNLSFLSLLVLFLALGLFTSAQILSYPLIAESNPRALTGTAEGLASVLIMGGGTLQPFFGTLMELNGHTLANGAAIYSAHNFLLAMSLIPFAFILGLLAAFFANETYCRQQDERDESS